MPSAQSGFLPRHVRTPPWSLQWKPHLPCEPPPLEELELLLLLLLLEPPCDPEELLPELPPPPASPQELP